MEQTASLAKLRAECERAIELSTLPALHASQAQFEEAWERMHKHCRTHSARASQALLLAVYALLSIRRRDEACCECSACRLCDATLAAISAEFAGEEGNV